jgi:hypothetical protein
MRGCVFCGLFLMILFGGVLGCGKGDPPPQKGVNPFDRTIGKDKNQRNPMMPNSPGKPK